METAYQLAYQRRPDSWEKDAAATFFHKQKALIAERAAHGEKIAVPTSLPESADREYSAAFVDFCQMLLASNEFVYRN